MRIIFAVLCVLTLSSLATAQEQTHKVHNLDKVDVKVDVRAEDIARTLQLWNLQDKEASQVQLYFFDTPDLSLFNKHVSIRGRQGTDDDLQVKIRPAQPEILDPSWFYIDGFKCKYDVTKSAMVPDCSLKSAVSSEQIPSVVRNQNSAETLLTTNQKNYLQQYGMANVNWSQVKALGPIQTKTWELTLNNGNTMDVELWTLPGYQFLELSEHGPTGQQDGIRAEILNQMLQSQIQESDIGENKTEFVMKIFAQKH